MSVLLSLVVAVTLGILPGASIGAQLGLSASQANVRTFYSVLDLKQQGVGVVLTGARPATSAQFPASFYSVSPEGRCTAVLVSSRALLTAAHCVPESDQIEVSVVLKKKPYAAKCTRAPAFVDAHDETADWALCLIVLKQGIQGVPYENINSDSSKLTIGSEILLSGFGCTAVDATGGNDGTYRIGEAPIIQLPSGDSSYILTRGEVTLCFGDSGGPAFLYTDANKQRRIVVSVNSQTHLLDKVSFLSSTSTAGARAFLTSWQNKNPVKICGIDIDANGCRKPQ